MTKTIYTRKAGLPKTGKSVTYTKRTPQKRKVSLKSVA